MVRGNRPLMERMTLVWHDWFATSNEGVGSQGLMLRQNALFRRYWLGSFRQLCSPSHGTPRCCSGSPDRQHEVVAERELRPRADGALHARRRTRYTERDVREQARALTGFRNDWREGVGPTTSASTASATTSASKRIFGRRGRFDWRDASSSASSTRSHPSFFVASSGATSSRPRRRPRPGAALERLYVRSGYSARPVVARSSGTRTSTTARGW